MTPEAETALTRLRPLCMAMPEACEKLSHGMPAFHIEQGKMFAYFWHNHHGDGELAVIVKTSGPDEQEMLLDMDPDQYFRPPYLGPSGWIGLRLNRPDTDWDRVADRVAISWELVAPRRLLEAGGR
ncbi:MmcQ/YjbR family DNA-binding protein [Stakelama sediminis]|uniref:Phosphoribosylglycinamide formyltransferase-1/phosphoribosylamine--glycine ligase/phosphoribosylglycinamide formyltransferase/phosphoribosylformylglycinamidine cyclo-ligase n=1 Tax=Stakelama sediminis TaxID=463200 RepID=A0A840YZD3_9SPHN|nr:MmcQ/YjbR family DNA-binding protein [Stakelama sediminis]MBB5718866.1 phosphoribosylglycinamide formyltransferase-1/phosphoribosylamine--glycine ligase/phosphoribosylglycinamide formyltransferase/phosphoribosylformylglycinamidine cyclo-ligase [Stakelama sediminis]